MHPSRLAPLALVAALAACASSGATGDGVSATGTAAVTQASTDQSRVTRQQVVEANVPTAYDIVQRIRRPWLRRQGALGGEVVVYMDEQNLGAADKLREIPSVDVNELQYLTNEQATRRWGNQITGAVIVVVRRR